MGVFTMVGRYVFVGATVADFAGVGVVTLVGTVVAALVGAVVAAFVAVGAVEVLLSTNEIESMYIFGCALPAASCQYRSLSEAGDPKLLRGIDTLVQVLAVAVNR